MANPEPAPVEFFRDPKFAPILRKDLKFYAGVLEHQVIVYDLRLSMQSSS